VNPLSDLRGIITVLNTPFTVDDRIDREGLRKNVEYAIHAGVVGVLVPAMASEVDKLSNRERDEILDTVLQTTAGRAAVIGGASSPDAAQRLRLARRCMELGCDGVLVSIPYTDDAAYTRHVQALAALEPPLLMLQDWDATGPGLPIALIARLFEEIPCFRSLKIETLPAGPKYTAVREATGGRLHLAGGWAVMQMIEALDRGVHAFMPTGLHHTYCRIYRLYHAGRRDEARALFNRVLPVLAFSNQHLDISIHFFKRLLHRQGLYATPRVRQPIAPFDAIHEHTTEELLAYLACHLPEEKPLPE
jgi:4-hydroxy-tetrahydrodipicolinate synthase